jgi:hypothetical protein
VPAFAASASQESRAKAVFVALAPAFTRWYAVPPMSARASQYCVILIQVLLLSAFVALKSSRIVNAGEEQALIVAIRLRSGDMGDAEEHKRILALEHELSAAVKESGAGEFDGDEFGKGVCTIYMYGPSAEPLYSVAAPILKGHIRFHVTSFDDGHVFARKLDWMIEATLHEAER